MVAFNLQIYININHMWNGTILKYRTESRLCYKVYLTKMEKLHFKSKPGIILYDSSQMAGVDYNLDALQNKKDPF